MKTKQKFHCEKNLLTFSLELDPDPISDPDPHSSKRLHTDPQIRNPALTLIYKFN
jgi:hypothetical protein